MTQHFYIGVDGGATKCIVRVEDEAGRLLGRETTGSANIRLSVPQAWRSINAALQRILEPHSLSLDNKSYRFNAGMGLAGCEVTEAYQSFINHGHAFNTLIVSSDSHTACLGAHQGKDGAIIIAGTGVVGFQLQAGKTTQVGGWGFPHDDEGGGAWLGLKAIRTTLHWLDGRYPASGIATAVFRHFGNNLDKLVSWANKANSTLFAELAPLVIQQAKEEDAMAISLLQQAALALDEVSAALQVKENNTALPCSLLGGIAPFLEPYVGDALRARLAPSASTPDVGAILLVRHHLNSLSAGNYVVGSLQP